MKISAALDPVDALFDRMPWMVRRLYCEACAMSSHGVVSTITQEFTCECGEPLRELEDEEEWPCVSLH